MRVPWWIFTTSCAISFISGITFQAVLRQICTKCITTELGHVDENISLDHDSPMPTQKNQPQKRSKSAAEEDGDSSDTVLNSKLLWELNMRRARPYNGITVPDYNGYSAKCIPDQTLQEMNAQMKIGKLKRSQLGKMDGLRHDVVPSESQVGSFVFERMKYDDDGRPIWTNEIWHHIQNELNKGMNVGPPNYRDSGNSVSKAVTWALQNRLESCGTTNLRCSISVFSAISPWVEAILFWSASKLRRNVRITSVDFNPCVLVDIPPNVVECQSTLSLVERPDTAFDLTVSYSGIEHDGLGRYGDPVNPEGDISAMREMWLATRPGGLLLLAVPCAGKHSQPRTSIPIWGNQKIQILQHRAYGAERYMRLLVGWDLLGFVLRGKDVLEAQGSKMTRIATMIQCSFSQKENQPLLILQKNDDMTFDDVLVEGKWTSDKASSYEKEYLKVVNQTAACTMTQDIRTKPMI